MRITNINRELQIEQWFKSLWKVCEEMIYPPVIIRATINLCLIIISFNTFLVITFLIWKMKTQMSLRLAEPTCRMPFPSASRRKFPDGGGFLKHRGMQFWLPCPF